ncbi:MAG: class I SAM-dependent methyltransferase [Rhodospirillaceae bacterium]|nr:class I SAM-dependent methyltransferase [Rhodospirillaceae bacterium]
MREIFRRLSPAAPYFPDQLVSIQSGPDSMIRHVWQTAAVCLVKDTPRPLRILEIGSWAGHSTLTWAEAIGKFERKGSILCVDPWGRYLAAGDVKGGGAYQAMDAATDLDLIYTLFLHNIGFADPAARVDHIRGRFDDVAPYLGDGQFDIVYIDGSHYYADVVHDIAQARRLVRDGGLICGDDLEHQLADVDPDFVKANIAKDYARDPKGRGMHPGVTLAVAEAFGRVADYSGFWIMRREGERFAEVGLHQAQVFIPNHLRDEDKHAVYAWMKQSGLFG